MRCERTAGEAGSFNSLTGRLPAAKMSVMARAAPDSPSRKVLAEAKAGKLQPVYVLFGPDVGAADAIIEVLRKELVAPGLEAFDFEAIHAPDFEHGNLTVDEAVQRTRQLPFGSARRLVLIRNIDMLNRSRGGRLRTLCAALADTPDSSTVVLTCVSGAGGRERKAWLGLFAECGLSRFVVELRQPNRDRLLELVCNGASRRRFTIAPEAAELLVDIVGGETGILRGELDKLAAAFEPGARVTAADIRRLAGPSREYGLDEFVALFLSREPAALAMLRRLEELGVAPVQIIVWLAYGLLDLMGLKAGRLSGRAAWRVPEGRDRRWRAAEVDRALRRLYEINLAAVTGHPEPLALLDILTAGVCGRPTGRREVRVAG